MQFTTVAILAAASLAMANKNETVVYTTEVVTALTTYCPYATTLTHGTQTYTVTAPTTLTITDCPCTVTKPVYTSAYVSCPTSAPVATGNAPVYSNGTAPGVVPAASMTPTQGAPAASKAAGTAAAGTGVATGSAGRPAAAGLAGLVGLAAFLF